MQHPAGGLVEQHHKLDERAFNHESSATDVALAD
jgi:hypothetical protein